MTTYAVYYSPVDGNERSYEYKVRQELSQAREDLLFLVDDEIGREDPVIFATRRARAAIAQLGEVIRAGNWNHWIEEIDQ